MKRMFQTTMSSQNRERDAIIQKEQTLPCGPSCPTVQQDLLRWWRHSEFIACYGSSLRTVSVSSFVFTLTPANIEGLEVAAQHRTEAISHSPAYSLPGALRLVLGRAAWQSRHVRGPNTPKTPLSNLSSCLCPTLVPSAGLPLWRHRTSPQGSLCVGQLSTIHSLALFW